MPIFRTFRNIVLIQHIDKLRERRCDPDALFILDALHSLQHHFLDDHRKVISGPSLRNLVQIHKYRDKRSLSVTGHQGDKLVLDRLDAALNLLAQTAFGHAVDDILIQCLAALGALCNHVLAQLLTADVHKRCQMRQSKGLSAILVAGYLRHDLGGHVAGRKETVRLLDHRLTDHSAILQHILQIDQVAVVLLLCKIVGIMEMDDAFLMRADDLLWQQHTLG